MESQEIGNRRTAAEGRNDLAIVLGKIEGGVPSDRAVGEHPMEVDDAASFVPYGYLEFIPSWRRLDRGPAASLLDLYARSTADVFSAGSRPACIHAAKLEASAAYQRLGYRTASDYAPAELGLTGRSFRDMARLGERLRNLPATRRAFLLREITWTEAHIIGSIATPSDEGTWLTNAQASTVRELRALAREAREAAAAAGAGPGEAEENPSIPPEHERPNDPNDATDVADVADAADATDATDAADAADATGPAGAADPIDPVEPRRPCSLSMPKWMVGKLDAVLELAAQIAGANVPLGTRLEYVAAEFLSGGGEVIAAEDVLLESLSDRAHGRTSVEDRTGDGAEVQIGRCEWQNDQVQDDPSGVPTDWLSGWLAAARNSSEEAGPPEDRRGYRRILEKESGCWDFLPAARSPLLMRGSWSALAEECLELSKDPGADEGEAGVDGEMGSEGEAGSEASSVGTDDSAGGSQRGPRGGPRGGPHDETLWSLHRKLKGGLRRERTAAWQLGRLLCLIHDRRLWKDMLFCSFSHYVSERLGISSRVAQRLVRLDRHCWEHPHLADSYQRGELSLLKAEMLLRVVSLSIVDDRAERAWVEYAKRATFQRLTEAVQWAERECTISRPGWNRIACLPPRDIEVLRPSIDSGEAGAGCPDPAAPMFVTSEETVAGVEDGEVIGRLGLIPRAAVFVDEIPGCDRLFWLTAEEREVLDRAVAAVTAIRGPDWPRWACLNDLLDHFLHVYNAEEFRAMRRKYPLFDRDGWRCQVPGCGSHQALHLHHIVFRSHGGGDEPENLVSLCDLCRYRHKSHYAERRIMPRRVGAGAWSGSSVAREAA